MKSPTPHQATHLHVHSQYSLLAATPSVQDLVDRAVTDGLTHLALTDSNALYGAVQFSNACLAAGIQPIIGMATRVQPMDGNGAVGNGSSAQTGGMLVLLATGLTGYRSICRLSSHLQASPDREERLVRGLSWQTLKENADGLVCLSGGRQGWIARCLRAGDETTAARYVGRLGGIFGEQAFLSLELHSGQDQSSAQAIVALGERFGMGTVAVQPVYTMLPAERAQLRLLRLLRAIDLNCPLADLPRSAMPDHIDAPEGDPTVDHGDAPVALHWLSPSEMGQRFANFPDALATINEITQLCEPALPDSRPVWPRPALPTDMAADTPVEDALSALATAGLAHRYGRHDTESRVSTQVTKRLQRELAVINEHGFAPLFLVVADIVRYARQEDIPVSTRGSVANSLVAYCTGITTVDPIEHDLLFERFLNPARITPPDIDLDFCSRRRDEVLHYVRETYGADHVALVATISTMRPKSAVRETGKAYGLDATEISRLTRLLPSGWHPDPRRRDRRKLPDILEQVDDPRERQVLGDAYAIVSTPHHLSIHPGGVVITPGNLTNHLPLQWTAKGFTITQFDHNDVEQIGLPKIDLLGIRALTVLADATALVRKHHDAGFTLDQIEEGDPETEQMLSHGDTIGVFQCDSTGARRTLRQLKARSVRDLAVANAFFKPGPATGGMAQAFIRRYRGEEPVHYLHPSLTPILSTSKGVLLFQEQILRVAREIAGLSWEEADHLRRGMSKFQTSEMKAMRQRFVAGCLRPEPDGPEFTPAQASTLWEQVEAFAGYGFNQGHATAYADVSYRSAYIKAHWPAEFCAARLVDWGGFHHQAIYIAEANRLGIDVRPPHVNESGRKFTLTRHIDVPVLWMGLDQIRDLRRTAVAQIVAQREESPFVDLADLLRRVQFQAKEIRHLIQCGALDGLGKSRAAMLEESVELWRSGGAQQMAFSFTANQPPPETASQRLQWEHHLLGQPLTDHPLDVVAEYVSPAGMPAVPLHEAPGTGGRPFMVQAVRLPGWTGGKGFFVGDRQTYAVAIAAEGLVSPKPWQPLALRGRWRVDEWGGGWLQVDGIEVIDGGDLATDKRG